MPSRTALRVAVVAASCASCGSALRVGPQVGPPGRMTGKPASTAAVPALGPLLATPSAAAASVARVSAAPRMDIDFYDGYVETDPVTGEQKTLALDEKEKLYLECLDAFYNEDGKQLLSNEEYEQLKLDLDFDGSKVATYSKDEIRFVLANKRYKMGKPFLNDAEYDALRNELREQGSLVVLHDGASCSPDSGLCKTDLRVDNGKTRLLYLPGTSGGLLLVMEVIFWTLHLDPILSAVLGAVPAYFFGVWFTENIFAQKPLVTQANCPDCGHLHNIYFGDLFAVQQDNIVPGGPAPDVIACKCPNCKIELEADRNKMLLITTASKIPAKA